MRHVDGRGWVGVRVMMLVQVVGRVGTDAATSGVICVICVICVCVERVARSLQRRRWCRGGPELIRFVRGLLCYLRRWFVYNDNGTMPRRTTGKTSKATMVGSKKRTSTTIAVSSTRTKSIYGHGIKAKPRLAKKGSVKTTTGDDKKAAPLVGCAKSEATPDTNTIEAVKPHSLGRVAKQPDKKIKSTRPKRTTGNSSDGSSSSSSTNHSEKKKRAKHKKQGRSRDVPSPGSESTSSSAVTDWPPVAPATAASYEVQLASSDTTSSDGMSFVDKGDLEDDAGDGRCSSSSSSSGGTMKGTDSGTPMVPDEEGTGGDNVLDEQDGASCETGAATAESRADSTILEGGVEGENVTCHDYGTLNHAQESHESGSEDNIDAGTNVAGFSGAMSHSTSSGDEPSDVERLSDASESCTAESQADKEDPRDDFEEQRFRELDTADTEEYRRQRQIENHRKLNHLRHLISYSEVLRAQFDMRIEELKETIDELNAELMVQEGVTTANRQRRFRAGYKFSPSEADAIVQDMAKRSMLANSSFVAAATFPPYYTGNMQGMIGDGELEHQRELRDRDEHVRHVHKRNYPGMIKRLVNAYAGRPNLQGRSSTESHRLLRQKLKTVLDGNFDM